jgi:hypothetical protein
MPYIIITKRPCPEGHSEPLLQGDGGGWDGSNYRTPCSVCDDRCEVVSRRAVATLEEAWAEAHRIVNAQPHRLSDPLWNNAIEAWPKSGGMIGPLPDGTVIEVGASSWVHLALEARRDKSLRPLPVVEAGQGDLKAAAAIIAAFNAKQAEAEAGAG